MENTQKMAYAEVGRILDILGDNYKKKVPSKIRELFYKEDNPQVDINLSNINDKKISRKALCLSCCICRAPLRRVRWVECSFRYTRK